ncbi:uncharacterized protein LOC125219685 [Salvia hispanica]|uniref:uncharacterized protein LOC125219685 n=1 Tax=Salvia hispanica TaxID=49212 RepID=UPI0020093BBE|nr:uncharacterized protein LOC125219685 [Salvia hispanica]
MAFLFVDILAKNKSRFVQISCKILELLLLLMGLVSAILFLKDALNLPRYCKTIFSTAAEFLSSIKCFLSSSPTTVVVLMILLIFASSRRHHHPETTTSNYIDIDKFDIDLEFQIDHDHDLDPDQDHDHDHDQSPLILEPPPLPQPSAPPIWDIIEVTPLLPPPSDVVQPILIRDSDATDWYDDDVSNQDRTVGLQTHPISDVQSTVLTSSTSAVATIEKWKGALIIQKEAEEREATDQEEDNTMDATWEAIIGGGKPKPKPKLNSKSKSKPKQNKKGLKKSETWEEAVSQRRRRPRRLDSEEVVPTSPKWRELRKAETFNDAVSATRRGGLVRRIPSMSLEEFNQKVDRFIKNFKEGIQLQRQESYQRSLGIINQRG